MVQARSQLHQRALRGKRLMTPATAQWVSRPAKSQGRRLTTLLRPNGRKEYSNPFPGMLVPQQKLSLSQQAQGWGRVPVG